MLSRLLNQQDPGPAYWRSMFIRIASSKLTPTQKLILAEARECEGTGLTLTGLAKRIAGRYNMPLSTVKWNLRKLRELGLITGGNRRERRPYMLTAAGRELANALPRYHLHTTDQGMVNKK